MDVRNMSIAIWLIFGALLLFELQPCLCKQHAHNRVEDVNDMKDFKKILRTKNNVMVCFVSSLKPSSSILKAFRQAAEAIRGEGTLALVNCSAEGKKICKTLKVTPDPVIMKHYKDGEFNVDYDRRYTSQSMVNFMRDPLGDIPWEEETTSKYILHIPDPPALDRFLKRELRPTLIMFYAPWCGYCKQMKPEYAAAAEELKGYYTFAAMNLHRPENNAVRQQFNITSFPTVYYFLKGQLMYTYEGDNKRENIIAFIKDPIAPLDNQVPPPWQPKPGSNVKHLTTQTFDTVLETEESLLVMFHIPWCDTCIEMRKGYEQAADTLKSKKIKGALAAADTYSSRDLASRFKITIYPLFLYFRNGTLEHRVDIEQADDILSFMENPKEYNSSRLHEYPLKDDLNMVPHLHFKNFVSILRRTKHALVMFYAPWCEHCRVLKPEFVEAANTLKNDSKFAFFAVDCTEEDNTCKLNNIEGYPTLKYYMYYSRATETYSGPRMKDDFIKYLIKQQDRSLDGIFDTTSSSDTESLDEQSDSSKDSPPAAWEEQQEEKKHIVHLTDLTFDEFIGRKHPVLVIFYRQCEDCANDDKLMHVASGAATELAVTNSKGMVAAFDCTEDTHLADRYKITKFPTVKLFNNGHFISDLKIPKNKEEIYKALSEVENIKDEL